MIAPLKTHFLGLIRLSLILARSRSGVMPEILPSAKRRNNPKLLVRFAHVASVIVNANHGIM